MQRVLVCKYCWIEVMEMPIAKQEYGRGSDVKAIYKHKSVRDDKGNSFCGRAVLTIEDVTYTNPVEEEKFLKSISDEEA